MIYKMTRPQQIYGEKMYCKSNLKLQQLQQFFHPAQGQNISDGQGTNQREHEFAGNALAERKFTQNDN